MNGRLVIGFACGVAVSSVGYVFLRNSLLEEHRQLMTQWSTTMYDHDIQLERHPLFKFGIPQSQLMRRFENHLVAFDYRLRVPLWTLEFLTSDIVGCNRDGIDRGKCWFRPDNVVPKPFRASNDDYWNSGFDRGHMAASANHRHCQNSMQDTFLLTNVAPQVGKGFNRDKWNELEMLTRRLSKKNKAVWVLTGCLWLPRGEISGIEVRYRVLGDNNIAVPTHFFKLIIVETSDGATHIQSFLLPNQQIADDQSLTDFVVPVSVVETASGLKFCQELLDLVSRDNEQSRRYFAEEVASSRNHYENAMRRIGFSKSSSESRMPMNAQNDVETLPASNEMAEPKIDELGFSKSSSQSRMPMNAQNDVETLPSSNEMAETKIDELGFSKSSSESRMPMNVQTDVETLPSSNEMAEPKID